MTTTLSNLPDLATDVLADVVAGVGGDTRAGQIELCRQAANAFREGHHLLAQAPTGTGKTYAYLAVAAASDLRVLVSTHGKRLQRQLVGKDLPAVRDHAAADLTFALRKGRQDYVCKQRARTGVSARMNDDQDKVDALLEFTRNTQTGDRADLPVAVDSRLWRQVALSPNSCPGASNCPDGATCFSELAKQQADESQVVVTNHHMLAYHLKYGQVLGEFDVVVIDEAHELAEATTTAFETQLTSGRIHALKAAAGQFLTSDLRDTLDDAAEALDSVTITGDARRLSEDDTEFDGQFTETAQAVASVMDRLAKQQQENSQDTVDLQVAMRQAGILADDLQRALTRADHDVVYVDDRGAACTPLSVAGMLSEKLFAPTPTLLLSATMTVGGSFEPLRRQIGLDNDPREVGEAKELIVDTPFDMRNQAQLHVTRQLPHPTKERKQFDDQALDVAADLIEAVGGRTLLLTTTSRARDLYATELAARLPDLPMLCQGQQPDAVLTHQFKNRPETSLVATLGYWQGIDVPGDACSLVIIDRIPFPYAGDPVIQARQDAAGGGWEGFAAVSVPHAAVLLAQAAGRLIRTPDDRGVVVCLDSRLGNDRQWVRTLRETLPNMYYQPNYDKLLQSLDNLNQTTEAAAA